jgi:glycosyltransferase involved in cell wall biosynthesis
MAGNRVVTAIIPVYNGQDFVRSAIESVLNQTFASIECLVIDDGSTDDTPTVVAGFGSAVRCIRTPNGGVAWARNCGIHAATGEYVAFLDADDLWKPSKLERQMELFAERDDLGMVYCGLELVDASGAIIGVITPPAPLIALRNTLLLEPPPISVAQTAVVPRRIAVSLGGFDERLSTCADTDLAWRLAAEYPIGVVAEPLAQYRHHRDQMHFNLEAMERDMEIVFAKAFRSGVLPRNLQRRRRRAQANLALTLAAAERKTKPRRSLRQLARAFRLSPLRATRQLAAFLARALSRRLRSRSGSRNNG